MHRLLPALLLLAATCTAQAAAPAAAATHAAAARATPPADPALIQTALVVPGPAHRAAPGAAAATTAPADPQPAGDGHPPTTAAMLVAGLALMTGIAVRRWGLGRPR